MWVECFKKGGIAVLRNLTRPGRPKVKRSEMEWIMGEASKSRIAAVALQDIHQKTGATAPRHIRQKAHAPVCFTIPQWA